MLPKHLGQECPPDRRKQRMILSTIKVTDSDASTGGGTDINKSGNGLKIEIYGHS